MPIDMTWTQRRSRFVYGTGASEVSWTTLLPVRPWDRNTRTLGGSLVAGSGVPASYIIRRDHVLLIRLRFLESEWDDLLDMLAWGQASESFRWYPDALEDGEYYSVWLDFPAAGEDIAPDRSSEFPKAKEITVGIRTVSGNPWRKEFFNYTALPPDVPTLGIPIYLLSDGSRGEPATEVAGTYMDVGVKHGTKVGGEIVEVWMRKLIPASGAVEEPAPGVYRGSTDFSEFDVGVGVPAGITCSYNIRNGITVTNQIGDDPEEGRYLAMSYTPVDDGWHNLRWVTYSLDAWDGIKDNVSSDDLEMLARVYFPPRSNHNSADAGARYLFGPTQTIEVTGGDYSDTSAHIGRRAGLQIRKDTNELRLHHGDVTTDGGSGGTGEASVAVLGAFGVDFFDDAWYWVRVRWTRVAGRMERRLKIWAGAVEDEHAGWDVEDDGSAASNAYTTLGRLGWRSGFNEPYTGSRISYLAFSTDPINYPVSSSIPSGEDPWFLGASAAVNAGLTQMVRTTIDLELGFTYDLALRYRLGAQFSPGAVFGGDGNPAATWASLSQGQEATQSDPGTLDSAVWSRTASDAERITLGITPGNESEDILVWRKLATTSTWTQIGTIAGPHGATVEYADETIAGETLYDYAVSTGTGARGASVRVWSGPVGIPEYLYDQVLGSGYRVGFDPSDVAYQTELWDNYDDGIGGISSFALRATAAAGATEVDSAPFSNVPDPEFTFNARLRHKLTSFTVDDFGQYGPDFSVTIPRSE